MSLTVLSAGLSPAWQEILVFDRFRLGEVNRARECHWSASGKVLNVARAAGRLLAGGPKGGRSRCVTLFGGSNGETMARSLSREGVDVSFVRSKTPSRVCTTVIDRSTGTTTELVEEAGEVSADDLVEFRVLFQCEAERARVVVLTGSLPRGAPEDLYLRLLERVEAPAVLDVRGPELLLALPRKPLLVKPNREELGRTVGRTISGEEDLRRAMLDVGARGAQWVVVSQGRESLLALHEGRFYRFATPSVATVNPIGSGDSLAGGIAYGIAVGLEPLEAIRTGVAAAAENAATLLPADIEASAVERRRAEVTWEEL